jgi:hypothetical protein
VRRAVCRRCGIDGPFRELGHASIYVEGYRPAEFALRADGSVSCATPRAWRVDEDLNDFDDALRGDVFVCTNCDAETSDLFGVVVPELARGDKVLLPDGRRVLVGEVWAAERPRRMRVFAAGAVWDYNELERWQPHPGQQTLEVGA